MGKIVRGGIQLHKIPKFNSGGVWTGSIELGIWIQSKHFGDIGDDRQTADTRCQIPLMVLDSKLLNCAT